MILAVRPDSLRRLGIAWEEVAGAVSAQEGAVAEVRAGAGHFGRINQFLTPALGAFAWAANAAVRECAEQLQEGALAARDTCNDLERTDTEIADAMGGGGACS